jgi:hypothetical protein
MRFDVLTQCCRSRRRDGPSSEPFTFASIRHVTGEVRSTFNFGPPRHDLRQSIDDDVANNIALAARAVDIEKRITAIDRNTARLDGLEARVERECTKLAELILARLEDGAG